MTSAARSRLLGALIFGGLICVSGVAILTYLNSLKPQFYPYLAMGVAAGALSGAAIGPAILRAQTLLGGALLGMTAMMLMYFFFTLITVAREALIDSEGLSSERLAYLLFQFPIIAFAYSAVVVLPFGAVAGAILERIAAWRRQGAAAA